jgi:NAD-dependent SIR2 family protein deacetylase
VPTTLSSFGTLAFWHSRSAEVAAEMDPDAVQEAAEAIRGAQALLIGAGAGMGVDSGLPDFRGNQGFWKAYPPYQKLGLDFVSMANPRWFRDDPTLAWGFYGHRLNLYRQTEPHAGYRILYAWSKLINRGAFVFTSNVDGHFARVWLIDFDRIMEVHGSIEWLQCTGKCGVGLFLANNVLVDETTMRAQEPLPVCPRCSALARPNILMFNDWDWDSSATAKQETRLYTWLQAVGSARLVVMELGAGTAIPTVRRFCEEVADHRQRKLIRINLREPEVPDGQIGLATGALAGLRAIDECLARATN